ncbi:hypothetical protein EVAR_91209_1 [Eumeta japonica]|uniref:Uncharacterized protein n=1 Tax=Eumeta variegata TaxID=151549 RepID=A0A4C2A7D2_EUMVA|nr:hypothetical protein EVAR_91209_1 [Eumeta japonica]
MATVLLCINWAVSSHLLLLTKETSENKLIDSSNRSLKILLCKNLTQRSFRRTLMPIIFFLVFGPSPFLNLRILENTTDKWLEADVVSIMSKIYHPPRNIEQTVGRQPEDHLQLRQHIFASIPMLDQVYKVATPHTTSSLRIPMKPPTP